ncbi:MAG: alpha-amylase family glycosyl hydrolase, partial [Saprospiraceae bacterium]
MLRFHHISKYFRSIAIVLGLSGVQLSSIIAQAVTTDPYFPLQTAPVTITFNAANGNMGLKGYTGDVYAHTGVITTTSTSSSDWKYVKTSWGQNTPDTKLTKISTDVYQLTIPISLDAYYALPGGVKVVKMAFVFRSGVQVNGSYKEGKEANGEDIFVEVFDAAQGLQTLLLSPGKANFVSTQGSIIPVHAVSSLPSELNLFVNGNLQKQVLNATDLSYDLTVGGVGTYHAVLIAKSASGDTDTLRFNYVVLGAPEVAALPTGSKLGLNRLGNQKFRFVLEAPGKNTVFWIGDPNDWSLDNAYRMKVSPDNRYFWIELDLPLPAHYVNYQYLVDESLIIADPLSEIVLDPFNDGFLTNNIFTDLPSYPSGKTSQIVSSFWNGDITYPWVVNNFQRPNKSNLIVYELLVRDFLANHDYTSLEDSLDYLEKLGVTAIELMPVNEFEGNQSWGYNISFHNAIDKYYGDPVKLKSFIDAAHQRGIAVIFDVVFNHAFGQSPLARLYWDAAANAPVANNPWLNAVAKHPFNVGYDFNHESPSTQAYMDRCLERMIEEFKVDGFRFDLSKGFTQVFSSNVTQWNAYDASRIALLKRMADAIWSHSPDIYVCLEHLGDNPEEKELADYGMMLWGKMTDPYNEATMGYPSDLTWSSYKARGWSNANLIVYMESHDEERLMYKNIAYGNTSGSYSTKDPITALWRMGMGMSLFLAIPGPKMVWQFGELGY